jgi:hypothetical protein
MQRLGNTQRRRSMQRRSNTQHLSNALRRNNMRRRKRNPSLRAGKVEESFNTQEVHGQPWASLSFG